MKRDGRLSGFEVFERPRAGRGRGVDNAPVVTLRKDRKLALNAVAYRLLDEPTYVDLLFATDERLIGFRASSSTSLTAYKVQRQKTEHGCHINSHGFVRYYGIETDTSKRLRAWLDEGMLIAALDKEHQE